ncbi:MAG: SpoIIE family protein phosphatase [Ignavibacteriaceae bacterium]|nr:SpoIIE family protein phosphatase [Ignavibacteriaceae bacterium]
MAFIKDIYLRNRQKFIIGLSAVLILLAIIELYTVLVVRVTSNDECEWYPTQIKQNERIILFRTVKVGGVTWNAGIRNGDRLLEINHIPFTDVFVAQEILNKVKAGDYADYTIQKGGKVSHTKVYVKKLIEIGSLANVLLALFQMLIGFIVFMSKPDGKVQKLFYSLGVLTVISCCYVFIQSNLSSTTVKASPYYYLLIAFLLSVGQCFRPFMLVAFFWTFPKPFKIIERKWVKRLLFILPLVFTLILIMSLVYTYEFDNEKLGQIKLINNVLIGIVWTLNVVAITSLIISYRRIKTREERKPVFIILIAYAISIAATIYTAKIAPAISDTIFNSPQYYTPIILIILVPIAFAYSIFKYQMMDVSVVVKNTLMYGTATVSLAVVYFFAIYYLGQSISSAIGTDFQGIIAGVIFIVFALVFQSTKDKFQDFITARFYPEQFAYQKVLVKFSSDVSTLVGFDNILDSMKVTFVEMLKINNFGILIKDKKDDEFHLVRSVGFSHNEININIDNAQQVVDRKLSISARAVIEQNEFAQVFPDMHDRLLEEGIFTIIPMIIKSKVVGLLLFGLKRSGSQFAGKDLDLLTASANQAAIAIENARLYESEAEKLKIERDLSLARRIQQGLLPRCIPSTNGLDICGEMIPAMQVGGDYFDLIPVSDSKLFVVVGDVSGKGLAASLYMTKLQTMIQFACTANRSPKEILIELNKRFYDSIERNSFVTMTLALFDTDNKTVTFCRAGHMPLLTATNGTVHSYRTQGLGVGLEKGPVFNKTLIEEEIKLKPGQIYAFFSDGITEAMNEYYDLFGEDKLSEILKGKAGKTSSEIMNEIWGSINTFRGSAEQNDDMTMVIVKVG